MAVICECCGCLTRSRKDRYCVDCETAKLKEMREAGYLTAIPNDPLDQPVRLPEESEHEEAA